tara:strand:+ start:227 stop:1087 length:861 start_codon:yes stop_codon:yes gene_type:complete
MRHFKIFVELTRINKPIGFMLLFWPCAWGLAYSYNFNRDNELFFYYIILFFCGSVLMRSAGCIFNDIVDKDFDKKVQRTKRRPIASGKISVIHSFIYVIILCAVAFCILLQFNIATIALGLGSMILAFAYPFMKRITYWPQLFLGITFNWGLVMAWTSMNNDITLNILLLYLAAIFWTLGYDTIYGAQDMSDDEIIGLKSTSIKFKEHIKLFLSISYLMTSILVLYVFFNHHKNIYFLFFLSMFIVSLIYQILKFDKKNQMNCLKLFKINSFSGLFLFLGIMFTSY